MRTVLARNQHGSHRGSCSGGFGNVRGRALVESEPPPSSYTVSSSSATTAGAPA
jgi:hypothetical protein